MHDALRGIRRRYARKIRRKAHVQSRLLVSAFAEVLREHYLGPGPWQILSQKFRDHLRGRPYRTTPDANPRHIYDDVLVGILPERLLNNGQPSGLARWFDRLELRRSERVIHVGSGTGYYTAILAHVVGPGGHVTALENDDELAPRAKANLAHLRYVDVIHGDGSAFDFSGADAIWVNAGATHMPPAWLESLRPGARLMFPLITTHLVRLPSSLKLNRGKVVRTAGWQARMAGVVLMVQREVDKYRATPISNVGIFPCIGAIEREADAILAKALAGGGYDSIQSVRRDAHTQDETCWFHRDEICFSRQAIAS